MGLGIEKVVLASGWIGRNSGATTRWALLSARAQIGRKSRISGRFMILRVEQGANDPDFSESSKNLLKFDIQRKNHRIRPGVPRSARCIAKIEA